WKGGEWLIDDSEPSKDSLKSLHKLIKKVTQDIENFSYNTSVAAFMICIGELAGQKCRSRKVLEPLLVVLAPFAPHITEQLWHDLGNNATICDAQWPECNEEYLVEDTKTYPVQVNGKVRYNVTAPASATQAEVQEIALSNEAAAKWLEGKEPRKVIVVPGRIVNIVL
ncbi:MAG: class I tRNA ligase family protein, partial [Muribaculaceae bacterium]|nr:class I tRNA ligase family protein [Muribaculaceae bacterium]